MKTLKITIWHKSGVVIAFEHCSLAEDTVNAGKELKGDFSPPACSTSCKLQMYQGVSVVLQALNDQLDGTIMTHFI